MFITEARDADCYNIWMWRNDPHTREMFRQSKLIEFDDHKKWYDKTTASDETVLLVGCPVYDDSIGVVRFDLIENGVWETSVNIGPEFRGKSYAVPLLSSAIEYFDKNYSRRRLSTEIRNENIPSIKMFTRSGYELTFRQPDYGIYVNVSK